MYTRLKLMTPFLMLMISFQSQAMFRQAGRVAAHVSRSIKPVMIFGQTARPISRGFARSAMKNVTRNVNKPLSVTRFGVCAGLVAATAIAGTAQAEPQKKAMSKNIRSSNMNDISNGRVKLPIFIVGSDGKFTLSSEAIKSNYVPWTFIGAVGTLSGLGSILGLSIPVFGAGDDMKEKVQSGAIIAISGAVICGVLGSVPYLRSQKIVKRTGGLNLHGVAATNNVPGIKTILGQYYEFQKWAPGEEDICRRDPQGITPLMAAARMGALAACKELVKADASSYHKDLKDAQGRTALDHALSANHKEVADYLKKVGAKIGKESEQSTFHSDEDSNL